MDAQHKILLVDDEPLIRRSMQKTLLRLGFSVVVAGSCTEGLDAYQTNGPFDLVLLDLNMPGFDGRPKDGAGLDLLAQLLTLTPQLPVIILTAYDDVSKAKAAIAHGAREYFVKGREGGLVDLIDAILEQ